MMLSRAALARTVTLTTGVPVDDGQKLLPVPGALREARFAKRFLRVCSHPEVRAWRAALAARPSVRAAVDADYPERLRDFLDKKEAWIGRSIASGDGIQPKKSYIASAAA